MPTHCTLMDIKVKIIIKNFSSHYSTYDTGKTMIFLAIKFPKNTLILEMIWSILAVKMIKQTSRTHFYDKNKSLI